MPDVNDVAQRAFEALDTMDPQHSERAELAAAKVAPSRIRSLYPLDFFSLSVGIREHLESIDLAYLLDEIKNLEGSRDLAAQTVNRLGEGFMRPWAAAHPSERGAMPEHELLIDYISDQLGGPDSRRATYMSYLLPGVLFDGWWLMHHADQMGSQAYVGKQVMYRIATSHLPSLAVRSD